MALALYLVRVENVFFKTVGSNSQPAGVANSGIVFVGEGGDQNQERANALITAADNSSNLKDMVIDDIVIGTGEPVKEGDTVSVHYVGTLQDGTEFDNSKKRGQPFVFTVGEGKVIKGWEDGLIGMKEGGQRILVIPPSLAYGDRQIGPIPANSTLVFAIELLEIK
ncbi:MAG: FKBP-type peptidyl-prolyl cis-trans isomerase [Candidatus Nomurabacteria bacterium]|nr:MAG: FKBP-type peptidyl-prolyl cis-trans isomerase [Candidatus Nomurabacteria bacterium]